MRRDLGQFVTHAGVVDLYLRQASEQYSTCAQFLAHALRHVMSRPHVLQGLLGKLCLLPLNVFFCGMGWFFHGVSVRDVSGAFHQHHNHAANRECQHQCPMQHQDAHHHIKKLLHRTGALRDGVQPIQHICPRAGQQWQDRTHRQDDVQAFPNLPLKTSW